MASDARNVVLITADSLRADHCGFMNTAMDLTPNLDRMSTESIIFENALAPGSRTPSSVPEITTGKLLPTSNSDLQTRAAGVQRIAEHISQHKTIAERFAEMGYSTAAYTANPWVTSAGNFDAGFDQFHVVGSSSSGLFEQLLSGTPAASIARFGGQWWRTEDWFSQWRTFYDDLTKTIEQLSEPYFIWVFLLDTHNPYIVPKEDRYESNAAGMYYSVLRGNSMITAAGGKKSNYQNNMPERVERRLKQAYRDSIRSVDHFVGTLQNDLTKDNPIIAFLSDHGEAFGEHGTYGHRRRLYEENIHVPFIIHNTDQTGRIQAPMSLRTLPELLTKHATGKGNPQEWSSEYVFSRTEDDSTMAVRSGPWKFISTTTNEELYDLSEDIREQENIVEVEDERAEQLRNALTSFATDLSRSSSDRSEETVGSDVRNRLESLGYK